VVKPTIRRVYDYKAMAWADLNEAESAPLVPESDAAEELSPAI
jgi:hypothetical protein